MSLAGINSLASTPGTGSSEFNTIRKQDSNQLFSALENGDLSGAQSAYSQLAALNDKGSGGPYIGPKLSSDFAAIGQALQNGDLTGAQEASLQFGQDLLAANEKLHGGNGNPQPTPSVVVNLSRLIDEVNPNNANSTPAAATPSTTSAAQRPSPRPPDPRQPLARLAAPPRVLLQKSSSTSAERMVPLSI